MKDFKYFRIPTTMEKEVRNIAEKLVIALNSGYRIYNVVATDKCIDYILEKE
jgi:hypothetical protein